MKKTMCVILALFTLLGILAAAPISAGAAYYPSMPSSDDIRAAEEEMNFPKPKNLRVVSTSKDSVTIAWKYEDFGYTLAYTTDPDQEPEFKSEVNVRTSGTTEDWNVTVPNLTVGKTYYIYVKHSCMSVVKMYLSYLSGEAAMLKVKLKADNTVSVKTQVKAVKASAMKKAAKTVRPLTVSKPKGALKVVKVKSGTTAKIYGKITVNKKNGAITFKKGSYKKGTYKVKLKVTAAGNSSYKSKTIVKTVKIKVK